MAAEIAEPARRGVTPVCGAPVVGSALWLSLATVPRIGGFGPLGRAAPIGGQLLGGRCPGRVVRP